MRKITAKALAAFQAGRDFTSSNTSVKVYPDGVFMYLFGNAIAHRDTGDGRLFVRTAGWDSTTTKERLNALPGVSVWHHRKVLHLNGKPWEDHESWTEVES